VVFSPDKAGSDNVIYRHKDVNSSVETGTELSDTKLLVTIKTTRCTNFSNLFWNEPLYVSGSSSVYHQEFFTVHTAMVCVIQVY
jgi:hypothetical protein